METQFHATTICAVRKNGKTAIAGDGQVTFGEHTIMKANARKVRRLYHNQVLAGFAGSVADAFTLFEKFEAKLETYNGNLQRAAVELAKEWRTDKILRKLEALLLVADKDTMLMLSGNGEVSSSDWFRRLLCPVRWPGYGEAYGDECWRDCQRSAVDCRRYLRIYQS